MIDDALLDDDIQAEDYSDSAENISLVLPRQLVAGRLDAVLAKSLPEYSRSRLVRWIESGNVLLDGKAATSKTKVWGGETVQVTVEPDPAELPYVAEEMPLTVVYQDNSLIIIDKPPGLVVHPAAGNWSGTLLNGLLFHYPELAGVPRAGIVHRLDKDTSGLMVVARSLVAQTDLVRQLQARTVKRHYYAVVTGVLVGEGSVTAAIGRHPKDRVKMAVVPTGKPAVTHYRSVEPLSEHTLVECRLETGRTHQIRVHMAHIGHSLAADPVYGNKPRGLNAAMLRALDEFARQALHAVQLSLVHPATGEWMTWQSQLPEDMSRLLTVLRAGAAE